MPGLTLIAVTASMLASAQNQRFPVIDIPNDPAARYDVLMLVPTRGGKLEIVTRRVGRRGETFVQREIDCRAGLVRYLGQGRTVDEMNADDRNYMLDPIDPNSISGHIAAYACENVVRPE
jgi:hypothetical protein